MKRPRSSIAVVIALLLVAAGIGAALGIHFTGGARLMAVEASPDGRLRIELYHANRWQALWNPNADMLGYARLTNVADNEPLGTSGAFDLSGQGEIFWSRTGVQISTSAMFDNATGRWTILQ